MRRTARQMSVRKVCARCGVKQRVPVGQVKCRQARFGKGSYACWGDLTPVVRRRTKPIITLVPNGPGCWDVLTDGVMMTTANLKRAAAAKQRDAAQKKVEQWSEAVANASRRLREWQQRANRYARQANLTDAEIAAQSEAGRRANAAKPVVRALKLPKGGAA